MILATHYKLLWIIILLHKLVKLCLLCLLSPILWLVWCGPPVPFILSQSLHHWVPTTPHLHYPYFILCCPLQVLPIKTPSTTIPPTQSQVPQQMYHQPVSFSPLTVHKLFLSLIISKASSFATLSTQSSYITISWMPLRFAYNVMLHTHTCNFNTLFLMPNPIFDKSKFVFW